MRVEHRPQSREQWLKLRLNGIGASEASAVIGQNPYMSNIDLWEYKTCRREHEDISDKPYVRYGTLAEEHLRALFTLDFENVYDVGYDDFDMYQNNDYPFIFATLDGRLIEKSTGRLGILEIKTTEILRSMQREKWINAIPQNYYIQVIHQFAATGWDFAILKAQLKYDYGGDIRLETKHYKIERSEVKDDIDYLIAEEIKFWEYVKRGTPPPRQLYLP